MKDIELLGKVQGRAMKMIIWLEHLFYEEAERSGILQLGEKEASGRLSDT